MFCKQDDSGYKEPAEGIKLKSLVHGPKTHLVLFHIQKGTTLAEHEHPHEQTGYLLSGKMLFIINGEQYQVEPGDSWSIPENIPHSAKFLEDCSVLEVFAPPRKEFMD